MAHRTLIYYNYGVTRDQAYVLGLTRAHTEKIASKDYLAASLLGSLLGAVGGGFLGGEIGYWFSPSPYYRDVNWSQLQGQIVGGVGGALAGAGLGSAAIGIVKALK